MNVPQGQYTEMYIKGLEERAEAASLGQSGLWTAQSNPGNLCLQTQPTRHSAREIGGDSVKPIKVAED